MRRGLVVVSVLSFVVLSAGCAVNSRFSHPGAVATPPQSFPAVAVRFVTPPEPVQFTSNTMVSPEAQLVVDEMAGGFGGENFFPGMLVNDANPYHVVLWGGDFSGNNVTFTAAPLTPGDYMFGVFDQDRGAAYQGWLNINGSSGGVLDSLTQWRNTVQMQENWLGFEYKVKGKFETGNTKDFAEFTKDLSELRSLERRINHAIVGENIAQRRSQKWREDFMKTADVLMFPGTFDFFRPSTRSTFSKAELASVRTGKPINKVVFAADYSQAVEKFQRINSLRKDLKRCRTVLTAQVNRLHNQKRLMTITNHLFKNDSMFAETDAHMQNTIGMIQAIDQQIENYRHQCYAHMFIASLASPGETFDPFTQEQENLRRERLILEEQKRQIDMRFNDTDKMSMRRVSLERDRQHIIGEIESIDSQIGELGTAKVAMTNLKHSTEVIHRMGPARIMTATIIDGAMPSYIVDALESGSIMNVRLQKTDSMYAPNTKADLASFNENTFHNNMNP